MDPRTSSKVQSTLWGSLSHDDASSGSFSLTRSVKDREHEWHNDMFIERLWIIEKMVAAAGMSQPSTKKNMDMNIL